MSSTSDTASLRQRPIIVKKKKIQAAAHHGGAWKVAYADFVTALMAFFLVMWLVTAVSKDQRAALFDYFKNPSMQPGKSVKPAPGQLGPGGASTSPIDLGGGLDAPRSATKTPVQGLGQPVAPPDIEQAMQMTQIAEKEKLESLMDDLRKAIDSSQALEPFKDQLLLDITPEGLRIQIVDKLNRPMFDSGRTKLKDYTSLILGELAKYLNTVPNRISLSGHTDAKPFGNRADYTNWELSAERANAARRALVMGGLDEHKIARVVGLASSVLFDKVNPMGSINRRISIIVMTKDAEAAALKTDAPLADATPDVSPALTPASSAPVGEPSASPVPASPPAMSPAAASVTRAGPASATAANVPTPPAATAPQVAASSAAPVSSPAAAALDAVAKANAAAAKRFGNTRSASQQP